MRSVIVFELNEFRLRKWAHGPQIEIGEEPLSPFLALRHDI